MFCFCLENLRNHLILANQMIFEKPSTPPSSPSPPLKKPKIQECEWTRLDL